MSIAIIIFLTAPDTAPRLITPISNVDDPKTITLHWQPHAEPNGHITGKIYSEHYMYLYQT